MTTAKDMTAAKDLTPATHLDDRDLDGVNGGDPGLFSEIAARVEHAVDKGNWKAFFEPYGPLASVPKKK